MATLGLFTGDVVLVRFISAITDFDVLCTLWVFTVDASLKKNRVVDLHEQNV